MKVLLMILAGATIDLGTYEFHASTGTYEAAGAGACDLSNINSGPNVDDTTADTSVTLSGQNCAGTLHVCMDIAADTPSRADCIANTGITDKQTSTPLGPGTETFTGVSTLTGSAETQYRIWAHLVPTNYAQSRLSGNVSINALISSRTSRKTPMTTPRHEPATGRTVTAIPDILRFLRKAEHMF